MVPGAGVGVPGAGVLPVVVVVPPAGAGVVAGAAEVPAAAEARNCRISSISRAWAAVICLGFRPQVRVGQR